MFLDATKYLSKKLDDKSLRETLSFQWDMLKGKYEVEGKKWIFKLFLWGLR